ncbi:MAG: efflux RND transporter permease subunit [Porticoccaceae bacterium]
MPNFFIDRPNFAWVVAIFISLAGLLAIPSLPVAQFPVVAPPQVMLYTNYPGASAEVVADSVTSLIEEELNGAKGLLYYESTSASNGSAEIFVTFEPGTDPDLAQVDVQNRLKKVEARLPPEVIRQGIHVEQANANFLMMYALTYKEGSAETDVAKLADFAARNVNNEIRRVPGVGRVQFFAAESAMRVWIDPQQLVGYGLSVSDVTSAIAAQNVQVPAGSFGGKPGTLEQELTATLVVKGMLSTPEEFGRILLRANEDGSAVYLSDVARIELGPQTYDFENRVNGRPAIAGAIQLAPGANAIATVNGVKKRLEELSAGFPDNIEYSTPYDTSTFVSVAIKKVVITLIEAVVLVFLVMLLFLQNLRYTLIPTLVVPVCLLGTFAVMAALGFSINMMTMFGMVLAIGILVDDAIVVVENVERIMAEEGLSPVDATRKAMGQISGAIVGITLVLSAVFVPLAFMSGSVGVIYEQFSVSLAVSILFSGFLALSLTPALCATLLRPVAKGDHHEKRGFFAWFNRRFNQLGRGYNRLNGKLLRRPGRYMVIYVAIVAVLALFYLRLPESFVPAEDIGSIIVDVQLPPGATYERTLKTVEDMESYLLSRDSVESVLIVTGWSFSGMGQNAAIAFPEFKDWSQRDEDQSAMAEVAAFNAHFANNMDGRLFAVLPPAIEGLGTAGGFSVRIQDRGALGRETLLAARNQLLYEANASPAIAYAMMEGLEDAPQLRLAIDREKAEAMGVSFDRVSEVISSAFGSATLGDFANAGRMQRVIVQAEAEDRMTPESITSLYVANRWGDQVPLAAFVTTAWEYGPVQIARYNGYPAIKISGDAAPGYSSGEAMAEIERILGTLPRGIGYEWTGLSLQEKLAGAQAPMLMSLSVLVVFLLLVALYESWSIPLSVMLIVPIGALGAVMAVTLLGMSNDVYFKVGLVTIIGLAAKNAILIVEFARDIHARGATLVEAATRAARLRFRPIIMTSMAFILGVTPMAIATGAGAASQRAIGVGVIGGMLSATVLGVIFVPVFYVWVQSLLQRRREVRQQALAD